MKFNKIFLGLGVAGFALTSCSDDVEYTPADPVNTPPVYFSMDDESQVDLEEDAVYFPIKVYRQNTSDNTPGHLTMTLSAEDGSSVADLFTIGKIVVKDAVDEAAGEKKISDILDEENQPTGDMEVFVPTSEFTGTSNTNLTADVTVEFPEGQGEYDIVVYFGGVSNLTQMLNYDFGVVAAGEASPYFITKVDYDVAFTPWETIEEGPVVLRDYTILAPSVNSREIEFEVNCQKHPIKKDFFRLIRPYADCGYGTYVLDMNDPNYLYINAGNPTEVFFSDKRGNCQLMYDTGIELYTGVDGTIKIGCNYSYNNLKQDLDWEGYVIPYDQLAGGGTYANGRISFGSNLCVLLPGVDSVWPSKGWTLIFPWAPSEWESIGLGLYTDGFVAERYRYDALTYEVEVEEHVENPGIYRLVGPYAYGVWPSDLAVPWNVQYNLVINCEDPNFVTIEPQTIFEDESTVIEAVNADYAYQFMLSTPLSKEEIIEEGLNDKMEDGVITIAHPILGINDKYETWFENTRFKTPAKLVLPTKETPEEAAAKIAVLKKGNLQVDYSTVRK